MKRGEMAVLIVDDEASVRQSLTAWFRQDGYTVVAAEDGAAALRQLQQRSFDVALLDIKMPGMDGMALQERIRSIDANLSIIMITAFASVETAVQALKMGAFDYVTKPIDPDELSHLVTRAVEHRRLRSENVQLRETINGLAALDTIIGNSPQMKKVIELIEHVAKTDATVLIRGESGTGKELIARAIHANSARRYFPIVAVNCGALPESLLESELFGHEKGAFTGAQYRRKGKIEMANDGTLFLDEVGTLAQRTQIDLLRILESKQLTRVGASKPLTVDFRVICATNESLEEAVKSGRFREDLYYRINVFTIDAPPLRFRRSDIPLLARHFLNKLSYQMNKHFSEISDDAMERLMNHDWPGNVRELSNAVERAMVIGKAPIIDVGDLPILQPQRADPLQGGDVSLEEMEGRHIARVLETQRWNITRTARILNIDRGTLYSKIKKHNLHQ